jgi:predicted enzyme related to lactoylglutathione lyase
MPGRLVHFELPARDPERAKSFYSALFGWQFEPSSGQDDYYLVEGEPAGALYPVENGENGPVVYFDVDDIDEGIAQVAELGGRADDKTPIPGVGWFARCWDTEGNAFSLFKGDTTVAADEDEIAWEDAEEVGERH